MQSRYEIERVLREDLERAPVAYERERGEFRDVMADTPSGKQQPEGSVRISKAANADSSARRAYLLAILEFSDFIVRGAIPERLRDRAKSAGG